jgi:hypothetical protein
VALVLVVGGTWGYGWRQRRRLREATAEAAAKLGGRYEPGSHTMGGNLYGKYGGRDVVFTFFLASTSRPEMTIVSALMNRSIRQPLHLKGSDVLTRAPRLAAFRSWLHHLQLDGWYYRLKLDAESNLVSVRVPGVIRDSTRLVELAAIVADLAKELETV